MATKLKTALTIRKMSRGDLQGAVELSQELSWPHRAEDWDLFYKLGEGMVADIGGRIVGTIMGFRFGADYASIGMVIVTAEARGQGIGGKLMHAMLARLEGCNVVLNAPPGVLPFYTKLGFFPYGVVRQHQGPAPKMPLPELMSGERVRPVGGSDTILPELYSQASGLDRRGLLEALGKSSSSVVLSRDHEPVGFAFKRLFGKGQTIGPVVAPDLSGARVLISHCLGARPGKFCRIDVVEGLGLSRWLEAEGFPCVGALTTVVKGVAPRPQEGPQVFAIAAQTLC